MDVPASLPVEPVCLFDGLFHSSGLQSKTRSIGSQTGARWGGGGGGGGGGGEGKEVGGTRGKRRGVQGSIHYATTARLLITRQTTGLHLDSEVNVYCKVKIATPLVQYSIDQHFFAFF